MADRGFDIQDLFPPLDLNIPAFLSGRPQLTKAEVKESQGIASVRIHVESAIPTNQEWNSSCFARLN